MVFNILFTHGQKQKENKFQLECILSQTKAEDESNDKQIFQR